MSLPSNPVRVARRRPKLVSRYGASGVDASRNAR
jgi:hypothetical protein